jgi:D-alanyl-D-alanine carboxypeptidase/D-alanyl-D-alanine-endopeptidase (penicillin-binding protein 4)
MKAFLSFLLWFFILILSSSVRANPEISLGSEMEAMASQYESGEVEFGVFIQDLNSGQVVYSKNADLLLNPASNTKILTALASLSLLGGDYSFKTHLLGRRQRKRAL